MKRKDIGDPKLIVAHGYDVIGEEYAYQAVAEDDSTRAHYTSILIGGVAPGAKILDLGCGAGLPTTAKLAEHFNVTGVDISEKQIERARANVPNATFFCADIAKLDFEEKGFDGVAAFFSIIHMPRDEHTAVIRSIARWLRPGGLVVASLPCRPGKVGYEEDWMGAPMFWSGFGAEVYTTLVAEAGLEIVSSSIDDRPDLDNFLWVVARKPLQ